MPLYSWVVLSSLRLSERRWDTRRGENRAKTAPDGRRRHDCWHRMQTLQIRPTSLNSVRFQIHLFARKDDLLK